MRALWMEEREGGNRYSGGSRSRTRWVQGDAAKNKMNWGEKAAPRIWERGTLANALFIHGVDEMRERGGEIWDWMGKEGRRN